MSARLKDRATHETHWAPGPDRQLPQPFVHQQCAQMTSKRPTVRFHQPLPQLRHNVAPRVSVDAGRSRGCDTIVREILASSGPCTMSCSVPHLPRCPCSSTRRRPCTGPRHNAGNEERRGACWNTSGSPISGIETLTLPAKLAPWHQQRRGLVLLPRLRSSWHCLPWLREFMG